MNILVLALALALMPAGGQAQGGIQAPGNKTPNTQNQPLSQRGIERIVEEVHHQLVLLPYYGVFDNLAYKVSPDGTVTLLGQVARPTLRSEEHTSELQSHSDLVCRLLLEKKKT